MSINSYANRGMYIEELINNTIEYYLFNNVAFFEKRFLPINIIKRDKNMVEGKLLSKSYVDYCGIYEGRYICFETKQTNEQYFLLNQIKEHQLKHLIKINEFKGISFVIVHFFSESKTFLVSYEVLEKWVSQKVKKIPLSKFESETIELEVSFPGILDFLSVIKKTLL